MHTEIQMILTDRGEILIAGVSESRWGRVALDVPALLIHDRAAHGILGFMLAPWLPVELLSEPTIQIAEKRIAGYMTPTPELLSFYKVWAETEREKVKLFARDFSVQVTAIEKYHIERFNTAKERKKKEIFVGIHTLPDTLIKLFEEETDWGDPSVTQ